MGYRGYKTGFTSCCYECPNRHPACHDNCLEYLKVKQEYEERKEIINEARAKQKDYDNFKATNVRNTKKAMKNRGR